MSLQDAARKRLKVPETGVRCDSSKEDCGPIEDRRPPKGVGSAGPNARQKRKDEQPLNMLKLQYQTKRRLYSKYYAKYNGKRINS